MTVSQSVCEVLRAHVVLESECIDRMYLQCLQRHCRYYLPLLTMSCNPARALVFVGKCAR